MSKKYVWIMTLLCALCLVGCSKTPKAVDASTVDQMNATIEITDMGKIVLELYPKKAPQTVANFTVLARDGFYDGLIFHRVINGFMIQGGDPTGTGQGGTDYTIKGEFSENGFENDILHTRGTISMARKSTPMDSAGSQFFIMQQDNASLDGLYAAFGKVTSGMDIVDQIAATQTDAMDKPTTDIVIKSITIDGPVLKPADKITN